MAGTQEQAPIEQKGFHEKQVVTTSISDFPTKPELQGNDYVPELEGSQKERSHELHNTTSTPPAWNGQRLDDGAGFPSSSPPPESGGQHSTPTIPPLYGAATQPHLRGIGTAPERSTENHASAQDTIAALEEEERRIDAEMAEARRMKELRDQKYIIQQKLRTAKSAGPFEM